jgi:hypothetical protein
VESLTIAVSGMIARVPEQGGATWAVLQYILGLRELGHRVFFVEECPKESLRPEGAALARSRNASYFHQVMSDFGLDDDAALLQTGNTEAAGITYRRLRAALRSADVLLNISGTLTDETLMEEVPVRVYLDLDPAFNQLWHITGIDVHLDLHTHFATIGQAIGSSECSVPTCGLSWIPTLPPVVLRHWPIGSDIVYDAFTTVGNWRAYGAIDYDGIKYGQKAHSLRKLISLPKLTDVNFALALAIDPGDRKDISALSENGWIVLDPGQVAGTPNRYQQFVRGSKGEFGIAKTGYVVSRCGWFSERSACYLSSGRPVVAQETGFSQSLPTGEGLFAFREAEDVLASIEEIERDYPRHAKAARSLAEEHFDSRKVLTRLLHTVGGRA